MSHLLSFSSWAIGQVIANAIGLVQEGLTHDIFQAAGVLAAHYFLFKD